MRNPGCSCINLGQPVARHPLTTGLAFWWLPLPHNQGGTRIFDLCGMGHTGVINGGASWVSGPKLSSSLLCDANGEGVEITCLNNLKPAWPVSWATVIYQIGAPTNNAGLFGVQYDTGDNFPYACYKFHWDANGPNLMVNGNDGTNYWGTTVGGSYSTYTGRWIHLLATQQASRLDVWLDGKLLYSDTNSRGSGPTYSSTSHIHGGNSSAVSRNSNLRFGEGMVWPGRIFNDTTAWLLYRQWQQGYPDMLSWFTPSTFAYNGRQLAVPGICCGDEEGLWYLNQTQW